MGKLKPKVEAKIKKTVESMVDNGALDKLTIEVRDDSIGVEAIFVDLWYKLSPQELDIDRFIDKFTKLRSEVHAIVCESEDERYPFVFFHFHEDQRVKEVQAA